MTPLASVGQHFVCPACERDGETREWCRCGRTGLCPCDMPGCDELATVDETGIGWCAAHAGRFVDEDDVWPGEATCPEPPVPTSELAAEWLRRLEVRS